MPTYSQLNQRHPSVDLKRLELLRALYEGDERLEKLYRTLLPRRSREREERYNTRIAEAQYRNYMGPIIDYFKSMLFMSRPVLKASSDGGKTSTPEAGEYWTNFRDDCDRGGTDIDAMFGGQLLDAMIEKRGWIRLHAPADVGEEPKDLAEYEKRGLNEIWLEKLEPQSVLDWELERTGRLAWAIVHRKEARRSSLESKRNSITETWDYLTPEFVQRYSVTYDRDKPPGQDAEILPNGNPVKHRFGAVPLVCLDLIPALWAASRLKSPQLAHFRKLNALSWSLSTTAYAMPIAKVGDPEAFAKQAQGPGYEVVIHKDDSWSWEAPPGEHFEALANEVSTEKDELYRIAHQMALGVENNAAALGRSADSKASDAEATKVILVTFSRIVRETIKYTLTLITRARGESYVWTVEGLDDFAAFDLATFLANLTQVNGVGGIPSNVFLVQSRQRVAEAMLPDMPESLKQKMRKEIAAATQTQQDIIAAAHEDPDEDEDDEDDSGSSASKKP